MIKLPMTKSGYHTLLNELTKLKNVETPDVQKKITETYTSGDIEDDSEYIIYLNRLTLLTKRMSEIEDKIYRADVIDPSSLKGDRITFGATVTLRDEDTDKIYQYCIVGADECDIEKGMIPIDAPLAKSLLNMRVNDDVEVKAPGGVKCFIIEAIQYI